MHAVQGHTLEVYFLSRDNLKPKKSRDKNVLRIKSKIILNVVMTEKGKIFDKE